MATVLYLAGFSEQDAKAIALAAWSPDTDNRNAITVENIANGTDPSGNQEAYHLLDGEDDPAKVVAKQKELGQEVAAILTSLKQHEDDPAAKAAILSDPRTQQILHSFGDSYAHVDGDGSHCASGRGHIVDSELDPDPDNPNTNQAAFLNYAMAIYSAAAGGTDGGGARRDASYVQDLAQRVANVPSEDMQKKILDNAVTVLTGQWYSGLADSPVPECPWTESCTDRHPGNTVNPVIEKIYGLNPSVDPPVLPIIDWSKPFPRM